MIWGAMRMPHGTGSTRSHRVAGVYAYAAAAFQGGGYDGPNPELRLAELLSKEERATAPRDRRMGKGWDRPLLRPNAPNQGILPPGQKQAGSGDYRYAFPDNKHVGLSRKPDRMTRPT